jgi:hypothetical protein
VAVLRVCDLEEWDTERMEAAKIVLGILTGLGHNQNTDVKN